MKTNYKLYTLVGLLGLSFTACELKEDLSSVYNKDNAYTTEENAQEGVNGIYRYLLGATQAISTSTICLPMIVIKKVSLLKFITKTDFQEMWNSRDVITETGK